MIGRSRLPLDASAVPNCDFLLGSAQTSLNSASRTGMAYGVRVDAAPTGRASVSADGRVLAFYSSSLTNSELWTRDLSSGRVCSAKTHAAINSIW